MSSDSRVAVFGCGPAGLIAAQTLEMMGVGKNLIDIFSWSLEPSPIGGAQFLHLPLLDPAEPADAMIRFEKLGDRHLYASKVYGDPWVKTSWQQYPEEQVPAWNLKRVYEQLWELWHERMIEEEVNRSNVEHFRNTYWRIFSTIPPSEYCNGPHRFPRTRIKLAKDDSVKGDNVVRYSGRKEDKWYRESRIFGEGWREYGGHVELATNAWHVQGIKPMGTDCDCERPWLCRVGRFGCWDKVFLLHHVPDQVVMGLIR